MPTLEPKTFRDIVNLLIPHCADSDSRKSLVTSALFGCAVLERVDMSGNPHDFVVRFVTTLLNFGDCEKDKPSLVAVLEQVKEQVGVNQHDMIDDLISQIPTGTIETSTEDFQFPTALSGEHVFISYSRENLADVRRLTTDLLNAGINVWIDQTGLKAGTVDWEQALRDAIDGAYAILFMASPTSRRSAYVRDELAIAQAKNKPIFPIWVAGEERTDCIPMGLGYVQLVDVRGDAYPKGLQQLIESLSTAEKIETPKPAAPVIDTSKPPRNPYKGLRSFRAEDAGDFYGRDTLIEELLEAFGDGKKPPRLLAVLGASGSGKSSVVMAGLMPRLKAGAIDNSAEWKYLDTMVPGNHPIENLTIILARLMPAKSQTAIREDLMNANKRGLHTLTREISDKPIVLYIDQFEELFTLVNDESERRQFIDLLTTATSESDGVLTVILSMRADFYDRPAQYQEFGALIEDNHILVKPMSLADLYDVVQKPAQENGLLFDEGLVTRIVFDVREESGALPLLQFTLDQLYQHRAGRTLTTSAYEEMGGVHGALAQHAEATFQHLPSEKHKTLARALFLRLIEAGATEQDTTRRRATASELTLPSAEDTRIIQETADNFVNARLLVTDQINDERTIEVSHEALIREWERLGDWLRSAREDLSLQKSLSSDVAEWKRRGQPDDMLYRGTVLEEAQAWAKRNLPSRDETLFLNESERAEIDRKKRDEAIARRVQNFQRATVILVLVAVIAGISSIFAVRHQRIAIQREAEANAQFGTANFEQREAIIAREQIAGFLEVANEGGTLAAEQMEIAIAQEREISTQVFTSGETLTPIPVTLTAVAEEVAQQELRASSLDIALQSADAYERDNRLGIALAVEAARMVDNPPIRVQRTLGDVVYAPGPRQYFEGHLDDVNSVAFSPDGKQVVSASLDRTLILWDMATGEPIRQFEGHSDAVSSVVFSPNGDQIVSGSDDNTLILWDVYSGDIIRRFVGHTSNINSVAYSTNGTLVSGSDDYTLIVWDVFNGEIIHRFEGHSDRVESVAFSPDGSQVVSGSWDNSVILWDVATGTEIHRYEGHTDIVFTVAFSPDGRMVVSGSGIDDRSLILWDVSRDNLIRRFEGHSDMVFTVAFSPDGTRLVSGSFDRTFILWNVATGNIIHHFKGQADIIWSVAFSPNGSQIITGSGGNTLTVWDVNNADILRRYRDRNGTVATFYDVAFSPDGSKMVSGSDDNTLILWDVDSAEIIHRYEGHTSSVLSVAFSPDGSKIVSGSDDNMLILWDVETGEIIHSNESFTWVYSAVFSPDGSQIASGYSDGGLSLWDVATGDIIRRYYYQGYASVFTVVFAPDGSQIASGYMDGSLILQDVETGDIIRRYQGHSSAIRSVAFSANGLQLLSGSSDNSLILWNVATGDIIRRFEGHSASVNSVAFSPDGNQMVSGSSDSSLILWDVESGEIIRRYQGHYAPVYTVVFSPDGNQIVSGSEDNTMILWRVDSLDQILDWTFANRDIRSLTCQERVNYGVQPFCNGEELPEPLPLPSTRTPYPSPTIPQITYTPLPEVTPYPQGG